MNDSVMLVPETTLYHRSWGDVLEYLSVEGGFTISTEHIPPGGRLPSHFNARCDMVEIILQGSPKVNGVEHAVGSILKWDKGARHEYDNSGGDCTCIVLTVTFPDFRLEDEHFL